MKKVEYSLELRLAAEKFLVKMFELNTPEPSDMMISAAMYCVTNTPWVADDNGSESDGRNSDIDDKGADNNNEDPEENDV